MKRKITYHSVAFIALIFIAGCSAPKSVNDFPIRAINHYAFVDSLRADTFKYSSLQVDKFNFRIDYRGELRTFKSSFYHIPDSLIYLNVSSTFAFSTASFYLYPSHILAVDKANKQIQLITYELLKKKLGFSLSFQNIQSVLFAKSDLLTQSVEFTINNDVNKKSHIFTVKQKIENSDSLLLYDYSFSMDDNRLEFFDISKQNEQRLLQAQYTYSKNHTSQTPVSVLVAFLFNSVPVEVELEFKNPILNSAVFIAVDSTYTVIPLVEK